MEIFIYKEVPSIGILKNYILSLSRPESKSFFQIFDPVGLRFLFQLRGNKWSHSYIDTPSGICHCNQGVEDTTHFLFTCPSYVTQRAALVSSVYEILHKVRLNHLQN